MDQDIAGATTSLELDKIRAQDERADNAAYLALAQQRAADARSAREVAHDDRVAALEAQRPVFSGEGEALEFRRNLILALAPNYMKPATTTTTQSLESATTEAVADAMRLKAALDEVLKFGG